MEKDDKALRSHFRNLLKMAAMDTNVEQAELDLLFEIGEKNGYGRSEMDEIIENVEQIRFKKPESKFQSFEQFWELVQMMTLNTDINDEEMMLCQTIGELLDIEEDKVENLIRLIIREQKNDTSIKEAYVNLAPHF